MDKKPSDNAEPVTPAAAASQPITLSDRQFEQLLLAVRDRQPPPTPQDFRYRLSESQLRVEKLFEDAAIALAVKNFERPAQSLRRDGDDVIVDVPKEA